MVQLQGRGASPGVAVGCIRILRKEHQVIPHHTVEDPEREWNCCSTALKTAMEQLQQLYETALERAGEESAQVFQIHQMMLEDEDYRDAVRDAIYSGHNAQWAVNEASRQFSHMFAEMEDPYMQNRAADVVDVSRRVIGILSGKDENAVHMDHPVILAAEDLSPSETIQLDKENILAFLTEAGSDNSHTAILARTMGIPAVVGITGLLEALRVDMEVGVDGDSGIVFLEPDCDTRDALFRKKTAWAERKAQLEQYRGLPTVTRKGQRVLLYANIGGPEDVRGALAQDAEGVGLFRTEFLYLQNNDYPTEACQFAAYRQVIQEMAGRRVIFRTLDIGADKQADYFRLGDEENPAMGLRAIRICLERPEIFRTQLRAIYRAGAGGKIGIMFPMIASLWELTEAKACCQSVVEELKREGFPVAEDVEIGIMVETPAAAVISPTLAQYVDFFSIGTNDLTQYTLAADRQNPRVNRFCDSHHPAVLELIRLTIDAAHRAGAWCGICGELAADLTLTEQFINWGVDELSVNAASILPLREKIRGI